MENVNKVPLLAVISNFIIGLILNHFWLAGWYASTTGLPYNSAYVFILVLLVAFHGWRAWRIWKEKSRTTKLIDDMFED